VEEKPSNESIVDPAGRETTGPDVRLSVVVATRDRSGRLKALLDALDGQTIGREAFELVVINDGSSDGTAALVESRVDLVITHAEATGPAIARQAGWKAASGDLIAFTDDDCRPEPDWLEQALIAHRSAPHSIIQGQTRPDPAEDAVIDEPLARSIRVNELGPFFQTCNVFYPRDLLESVGGFDPTIPRPSVEDADLAMRALATGCGAVYAEDAIVNHAVEVQSLRAAIRGTKRWASLIPLVDRHPLLRKAFPWRGYVWRETHARLLVASLGIALAAVSGRKIFLLWAVPYLSLRNGWYPAGMLKTFRSLPKLVPVDAAEIGVLVGTSLKERRLLL